MNKRLRGFHGFVRRINKPKKENEKLKLWQKDVFWSAISSISGVVATVIAIFTIYNMHLAEIQQNEGLRPYFHLIEGPGIRQVKNGNPFRIFLCMENFGGHPATNVRLKLYFLDKKLTKNPEYEIEKTIANDIFPKEPTPWVLDDVIIPNNCPGFFIVYEVSYFDPFLNKSFNQKFFMDWEGSSNGEFVPAFVHMSSENKEKVDLFLKKWRKQKDKKHG